MIHKNYIRIIKLAFPVILANAAVPLLGLADTALTLTKLHGGKR